MKSSEEFYAALRAFQSSRVLLTALELDLFRAVEGGAGAAEAARTVGADERALGMLLNALVALGALRRDGDRYRNTEAGRVFAGGESGEARLAALHLASMWRRWSTLTECVRTGTRRPDLWNDPDEEAGTRSFIAAMNRNASERIPHVLPVLRRWNPKRVLDLGGGSGAYAIALAQADAGLRAEVLDLPEVVPLTRTYLDRAGVAGRVVARPGDMLGDDYGSGFDLVLVSAVCHMFGPEENRTLLGKAFGALEQGGHVAVQDFLLDPGRAGPPPAALFSLNMLVATERGESHTRADYEGWLRDSGFSRVERIELPGPADLMVAEKG